MKILVCWDEGIIFQVFCYTWFRHKPHINHLDEKHLAGEKRGAPCVIHSFHSVD